jgi:N-acetylglucosaminyldiphosphoundecaprenol N-acetyl-beta-D-mannosaminyltransferase
MKNIKPGSHYGFSYVKIFCYKTKIFFVSLFKYLIESTVSIFLLLSAFPIYLVFVLILKIIFKRKIFIREKLYLNNGRKLNVLLLNSRNVFITRFPMLLHVVLNRLGLVGISYISNIQDCKKRDLTNKPSVYSLWDLRRFSDKNYAEQENTDREYLYHKNVVYDFLLMVRIVFTSVYHLEKKGLFEEKINLMDIHLLNLDMSECVEYIDTCIQNKTKEKIFFANPHCFNISRNDKEYKEVLNSSTVFSDGIGVKIACNILNKKLKCNLNGTDLFPFLCKLSAKKNYSLFLLGGKPGIADRLSINLKKQYKNISIAGKHHGFFDKESESQSIISLINNVKPDILIVAMGVPIQEKWIESNRYAINTSVMMGVGGLFDFYSDNIARAPEWVREIGFEWFFRFLQEPKRLFKRYFIGNFVFIKNVISWKVRNDKTD